MNTRRLAIVLMTCVVVFGAPASGHTETEAVTEPKTAVALAALRGPTGVGVAPYLGTPPVETDNATVSLEVVPDPGTMVARLSSGEVQVGMLPSNVVAQLYNRDVPVQIAAVTLWGLLYVVSDDASITDWSDLEGTTIQSIGRGATPDILMRHVLSREGLSPDGDVELSYQYPPTELAQLVAGGTVDLALLPEPFVTQVMSRRDELRVVLDLQTAWEELYGSRYPQTAIVVRSDFAAEHPDAVAEALDLIDQGWTMVTDDPDAAGAMVEGSALGLPGPVVAAAIPRLNAEYVPVDRARDALDEYFAILAEVNARSVGGSVPDGNIYLSLPTE